MTNHARREQHLFVCSNCERREPKWLGRCPNCGEWNSFRETNSFLKAVSKTTEPPSAIPLAEIETDPGLRVSAGNGELDRVLGGGFMRGSTTQSVVNLESANQLSSSRLPRNYRLKVVFYMWARKNRLSNCGCELIAFG